MAMAALEQALIEPLSTASSAAEREVIIFALANAAFFYVCTVLVFLTARKTRLNIALAGQKIIWLLLIALVAIPAYALATPFVPSPVRVGLWLALAVFSWWVLYEVYRANWPGTIRGYAHFLWCLLRGRKARDCRRYWE